MVKQKSKTVYSTLMMIILIFSTDCSIIALNSRSNVKLYVQVFIISMTALMIINRSIRYRESIKKILLVLTASVLITIITTKSLFQVTYYFFICQIWFCYYYAKSVTITEFSFHYCRVMRVIAVGSLAGLALANEIVKLSWVPQFTSPTGAVYKFLGVSTIHTARHMTVRNFGPFWEPGTYQVYILLAIICILFIEKKSRKNVLDLILLIVTGMTTASGAFLFPLCLVFAAYFLKEHNTRNFCLILFLGIAIVALLNSGIFDNMLLKMMGKDRNSSFIIRWIGFEGGLRSFLQHPLFGSTAAVTLQIKRDLAAQYLGSSYGSNTGTYSNFLAYYGIITGGFMIKHGWLFFRKITQSFVVCIFVFAAFFLSTLNENLIGSFIVIVISMMGFHKNQMDERHINLNTII